MKRRKFCIGSMAAAFGFSIGGQRLLAGEDGPPRCGVKDEVAKGIFRRKSKWGKNDLSYHMYARDTGELSKEEWDKEFRLAFDAWSEITPLVFKETDTYKGADIIVSVGRRRRESFGRRGGVLAWASMPSGKNYDGQLTTKFDMAENWVLPEKADDGIVLRSVACHEIGHILGLDHSSDAKALMYPYINDALKPRDDDITKIQKLYGSGKGEMK